MGDFRGGQDRAIGEADNVESLSIDFDICK